jgi:hypothetical protein
MQAKRVTSGYQTGGSIHEHRAGLEDPDMRPAGETYNKGHGKPSFPCATLCERVVGFMENYPEFFHE